MISFELLTSLRMQKDSRAQAMSLTAFFSAERSLTGTRAYSQSSSTGRRWMPRSESSQRIEEGVQLPQVRSLSYGQFSSGISFTEYASIQNLTLLLFTQLHESSFFLSFLGQLPPSQLDIQMSLCRLYTSQLPSDVRIISASFLHIGNRFRSEDPASRLFVSRIIFDHGITGQHGPSIGCKVKLRKPQSRLVKGMQKHVLRDLIGDIKGLFDQISWQFELIQDLRILIKLLQHYVIDLLRAQQQLIKLQNVDTSYMDEFFVIFRVVRVEVDPLKLDDGVGVHPL